MTTTSYAVSGLTCGYCIAEVMEQVRALEGVTGVAVDLVTNGSSPVVVTSGPALEIDTVREALGGSGFDLTGMWTDEREEHPVRVGDQSGVQRGADASSTLKGVTS